MPLRIAFGIGAKIGGRIIASVATERMLVWALRLLANRTDTNIDNHAVDLLDYALQGDQEGIQKAAKAITQAWFDERDAAK
jgi:hypothetical protein